MKPNIYLMPFPMELKAAARTMALKATVDAMGVNCQKSPAWRMLMAYNVERIENSLRGAVAE